MSKDRIRLIASFRAWFFIAAFMVSGLLLSYWLYAFLDDRQQRQVHSEFENLASQRVQVLDNHMQRSLEVLFGLSAFLQQPQNRQLDAFRDYVSGSLGRLPEVQALEWIPIVPRERREEYESEAQRQGIDNYRIIEFDNDGRLRQASSRERYYPVYFAFPQNANVEAIGLDLASQPDRRRAIEASLASGDIVATAPVRLAQEKVAAVYGFLIFAPVYETAVGAAVAGEKPQRSIAGFALVVYRSIDLLEAVFADLANKGVAVAVSDSERPETMLYANNGELTSPLAVTGPGVERIYPIGHRQWRVSFTPTEAYLSGKTRLYVYAYPAISALLVFSFGVYAALKNRYLSEVEREVGYRTQALTQEVAIRREAEAQVQKAEKMYRSMFENAIDGIFQTTRDGVYLNANSALAQIYGYPDREAFIDLVKNIETQLYVEPQRRAQFVDIMQQEGKVADFVSEVYRADGSRIYILEKAITVFDDDGNFLYYEGNVQDITDRIAAERALQRANEWLEERVEQRTAELAQANHELREEVRIREAAEREAAAANAAKTQFLAGVSHEIRTPLNAIVGYSQILQQQTDFQEKHQLAIKTIAQSGNHLLNLIDDILDLSKIEAGLVELTPIDFDLSSLVSNVAYILRRKCEDKGLNLNVEGLGKRPVWVNGDEGKLRQILINLLSNAVKYTHDGEIILRVVPEDAYQYRFEVIDTGPGIPEKDLPRIFDQFFQRASWQEGTGLGLSIASRIAKAMNSRIQVRSKPGHGSNFFFHLDFESARVIPAETEELSAPDICLSPGQRCLALVVDDIQHNRDILQQMLEAIGCDVLTADSGAKALEYVAMQAPSIIFMDILMPDMDGIETREQMLVQFPELHSVFVAFSASAYKEQRQQYLAAGFDAVISKPFRVDQLHSCLRQLLQLQFEQSLPSKDNIMLDAALATDVGWQLIAAARVYNVTQLKRLLSELADQSSEHVTLARHWRQLAEQHQLGELIRQVEAQMSQGQRQVGEV